MDMCIHVGSCRKPGSKRHSYTASLSFLLSILELQGSLPHRDGEHNNTCTHNPPHIHKPHNIQYMHTHQRAYTPHVHTIYRHPCTPHMRTCMHAHKSHAAHTHIIYRHTHTTHTTHNTHTSHAEHRHARTHAHTHPAQLQLTQRSSDKSGGYQAIPSWPV